MPVMTLRKVNWNKGTTDNGIAYDYCRITCDIPIYHASQNEFGLDSIELEYGTADTHSELLHLKGKLPCEVDVAYRDEKKGRNVVKVVSALRVLDKADKPVTPK
ncbi:hypothetical protein [Neisseria sp. S1]|uniref:hypothetical protein n=1 Tax=Neisseria sp. S1 TaxID=3318354 RepID=UPI003A847DAF